ncbi:MAG: DNA-formamidopyrimidine glycosylase [Liquorilactobacillus ghanensis]|uniref:DNA-formamidopyrimidine glycosylase n=1 Tax=Liquorilactobacillus ghanensis TaxID=399370 RepID=UPI0039E98CAB
MPELPEVETVRRGLVKLIKNKTIKQVKVIYPKIVVGDPLEFAQQLQNKKIETIGRRGKFLLFNFNQGVTMVSHLRMEGKYFVKSADKPLEKHTHVVFSFTDGLQLRYNDVRKFGRMQLVKTNSIAQLPNLAKLGPEPLSDQFVLPDFVQKLANKKKAIKAVLLDQTVVAGLGNIYADEVLWLSKIHPLTPAAKLSVKQISVLRQQIITELTAAVKAGGTTVRSYTDAFEHSGNFQFDLHVYGRQGQPCQRCGSQIMKIRVAQRGTHFCPSCQQVIK